LADWVGDSKYLLEGLAWQAYANSNVRSVIRYTKPTAR
jgi:hypothetical protein